MYVHSEGGYDIPEVPQSKRLKFFDVCNARALAQAVLKKCEVNMKREIYDGEKQMPWNVIPGNNLTILIESMDFALIDMCCWY